MNLPEAEQTFLRELVKTSRQKSQSVRWIDRDGSERVTNLAAADAARVNQLARQLKVSPGELLRQAACLPVLRSNSNAS